MIVIRIALKQLQAQIVHYTKPFLHRSIPFCTRRKTVMQTLNTLLLHAQNLHGNVPCLIVHETKQYSLNGNKATILG